MSRKQLKVHNYNKFCLNCEHPIYEDQEYILVKAQRNNDGQYFHKEASGCVDSSQPKLTTHTRGQSRVWSLG